MDGRSTAKKLLVHYFKLLADKSGVRLDGDCISEIEDIVDCICESAATQALNQHYLEEQQRQALERQAEDDWR